PRAENGNAVDAIAKLCDRATHLIVVFRQWGASRTTRAWMRACSVGLAQCPHKRGEIDSRSLQIIDAARRVLTRQPAVDRPVERVALSWMAHRDLYGERQWQMWRQFRQPACLLCGLLRGPID